MTLEKLVHTVESGLVKLGTILTPSDPRADLEEEVDQAVAELQQQHTALVEAERKCAEVRARLQEHQARAALLPSEIEVCLRHGRREEGWQYALELDQVREALIRERAELPGLEQRVWSLGFLMRQMERKVARLQNRLNAP
jgi:chromosome segregation ATPase